MDLSICDMNKNKNGAPINDFKPPPSLSPPAPVIGSTELEDIKQRQSSFPLLPPPLPARRPPSASSIQLSPLLSPSLTVMPSSISPNTSVLPPDQPLLEETNLDHPVLPVRPVSMGSTSVVAPALPPRPLSMGLGGPALPPRPVNSLLASPGLNPVVGPTLSSPSSSSVPSSSSSVPCSSFPPLLDVEEESLLSANEYWLHVHRSINGIMTPMETVSSSPEYGHGAALSLRLPSLSPTLSLLDINDYLYPGGSEVRYEGGADDDNDNKDDNNNDNSVHGESFLISVNDNEGPPGRNEDGFNTLSRGVSEVLPEDTIVDVLSEQVVDIVAEKEEVVAFGNHFSESKESDDVSPEEEEEEENSHDLLIESLSPIVPSDSVSHETSGAFSAIPSPESTDLDIGPHPPELPLRPQSHGISISRQFEVREGEVTVDETGISGVSSMLSEVSSDRILINDSLESIKGDLNVGSSDSVKKSPPPVVSGEWDLIVLFAGLSVFLLSGGLLAFKTQIFKIIAVLLIAGLCSFVSSVIWDQYNLDRERIESELVNREMTRHKILKSTGNVAVRDENWGGLIKDNESVAIKEDNTGLRKRIKEKVKKRIRNKIYEKLQSSAP